MFRLPVVPLDIEELMDSLVSGRFRAVLSSLFPAPLLLGLDSQTHSEQKHEVCGDERIRVSIVLIRSGLFIS